jgi:hypothetical protein
VSYTFEATAQGRLEARITIAGSTTATVGGGTATITAGTYYWGDFLTEVGTRFATAASTTCALSAGFGRAGTGLVTITFGVAKAIVWVSTSLRDLLGFAGDSASATSHVGTLHARNVWLPNCHYQAPNAISASFRGHRFADKRDAENAAGYVWSHVGQTKEVNWLRWPSAYRSKTFIANEATTNESFERFLRDGIWGEASWGTPGGPVKFIPDAAEDSVYATYMVPGMAEFQPTPYFDGWVGGPHTIEIPRLVVVPGT